LEYETTLQSVARACVPLLADWCVIDVLERDGAINTLAVEHSDPAKIAWAMELREKYPPPRDVETNAVARVLETGEPELYPDVTDDMLVGGAQDEQHLQILRELGMTSAMVVPMRSHAAVIGAITFVATKDSGRHFTAEDVKLAHELAHRAAVAVDNARLFRDVREREAEVRLNVAMLRAQGEATLDAVIVTDLDGKVVYNNHRMMDLFGLQESQLKTWPQPSFLAPLLIDADGFRARLAELTSDIRSFGRDRLEFLDGRVFDRWTAPLVDETGDVRGRGWYYRDVTAERREEKILEEGRRRASFLAEAGAALTSTMDYRLLLERLADVATEWFADWCTIDLVKRDGTIERAVIATKDFDHLSDAQRLDALRHYPADPSVMEGVQKVIETGQWDMRDRIEDEWLVREARGNENYLALLRHLDLRAHLCVPLQVGDRVIGAITFVTTGDGRTFTAADLALAQELAFRTATAVEHARLYQEHTHISQTLQRSLLPPHLPEIPGVDVAARYHASGDGYEVGGDFYDLFKTGRDDWAIVLGDVCGKGADAAATTALARHTLRAAATQTKKPRRILEILNEAMLRAEQPFCTVAYARLQRAGEHARMTVVCGGHPLPLVVRADGTIETFGKSGTLLGCFPHPVLNEESSELRPGDTVVLYTDGVTEARSQGNVLGDSGLRAALVRSAGGSADEVADAVAQAALEFQDGDARDDIAVVVVKIV
jgi:PAS domain S-box-containing protein